MKRKEIKLSSLDKNAPPTVRVMITLQGERVGNHPPRVISVHDNLEAAQAASDLLLGTRHSFVTWWKDIATGEHVKKWPTMMSGKRRYFKVSFPYVPGLSDAAIKDFLNAAIYGTSRSDPMYTPYIIPGATRVSIDADRNRVETVMPTFEEAWAEKVEQGYNYGEDALSGVRFGYEIACSKFKLATSTPKALEEVAATVVWQYEFCNGPNGYDRDRPHPAKGQGFVGWAVELLRAHTPGIGTG